MHSLAPSGQCITRRTTIAAALATAGITLACLSTAVFAQQATSPTPIPALMPGMMDNKVDACTDFFRHANGQWLVSTSIPNDKPRVGAFEELRERSWSQLIAIAQQASVQPNDAIEKQVGAFYASWMNQAKVDALGITPIKPWLDQIAQAKDKAAIAQLVARSAQMMPSSSWRVGRSTVFNWFVMPDTVRSTHNLLHFGEGGLGMPDRDDYFPKSEKETARLKGYEQLVERMFTLAGAKDPALQRSHVMQIETALAGAIRTRVQARDPNLNYNPTDLAGLQKSAPQVDWKAYFAALQITPPDKFNLRNPAYATALAKLIDEAPVAAWQSYLQWQVLSSWADYLATPYSRASFDFYSGTLNGVTQEQPRARRGVEKLDHEIGFELGQLYVRKNFDPVAKRRMDEMIENLKAAFSERIEKLDWMTPQTKVAAQEKLKSIDWKIGYPAQWPNYSFPTFEADKLVQNVSNAANAKRRYNIAQIGQPVDPHQWGMTPSTVNAYANPTRSEIVFPAGILQPPFFNANADDAVNYGAIGMVIGHELTHHFDDSGRKYDAKGNLRDWWTPQDKAAFDAKLERIQALYSSFAPLPGFFVNGKLTSGENIADFGGLAMAYDAFKKTPQYKANTKLDGLSPSQRFYYGYAQSWRYKATEALTLQQLRTDSHSPPMFRVNGPLQHSTTFAAAFGCKLPEKDLIVIW